MGALAPEPDACPRCGADAAAGQEYCLECGTRLPLPHGVLPALAGAWRARLRWYPGDWVWTTILLLGIAATAAAVAVATADSDPRRTQLVVATFDRPVPATRPRQATSTPTPAERRRSATTTSNRPGRKPGTLVQWPVARSAYTVVLASFPTTTGQPKATKLARRASRSGLLDVGLLDSSGYPSLHPGYYVVFSGVYESADDAASALTQAQKLGFRRAYTRQIVS